jgi:hypothetical protein
MELSNQDRWLLTLKDGDVSFKDIKEAINNEDFDYDKSMGKHAVFHMILGDLDALCQKGDAARAFEKVNESEVSEIYKITPLGVKKAENLLKGQGHQK